MRIMKTRERKDQAKRTTTKGEFFNEDYEVRKINAYNTPKMHKKMNRFNRIN